MSKAVKVAAMQMNCDPGKVDRNLAHAEKLVGDAVEKERSWFYCPS